MQTFNIQSGKCNANKSLKWNTTVQIKSPEFYLGTFLGRYKLPPKLRKSAEVLVGSIAALKGCQDSPVLEIWQQWAFFEPYTFGYFRFHGKHFYARENWKCALVRISTWIPWEFHWHRECHPIPVQLSTRDMIWWRRQSLFLATSCVAESPLASKASATVRPSQSDWVSVIDSQGFRTPRPSRDQVLPEAKMLHGQQLR